MVVVPPQSVLPGFDVEQPHILVVDDDPFICTVVCKTLSRDKYRVEMVTSPSIALKRLVSEPFDLLLTDINMPEISGLELAERARAEHPLLGIVIMTGYGSFDNMTRAIRAGIADFITKPFDIEDLRLTIARALERQQLQRNNVRLQTLVKVFEYSQAINSSLDLQTLYQVVIDIVHRETGASGIMVWIAEQHELGCPACSGIDDHRVEAFKELAQHVHSTGELCMIVSAQRPELELEQNAAAFALPLAVHDEPIGVLIICYAQGRKGVLPELLAIIANQTSVAIRNARQYAALQELDHLKSEFIGIASHELRTPLSLVLGYTSLLRHRIDGLSRDYLQQVLNGALRISDIVDDLVNLRRSEHKQITLDLSSFNAWAMLHEIVTELSELAAERQVMLRLEHPPEAVLVTADREKITLALANLIDNALKFNQPDGLVMVVGVFVPERSELCIEVRDTGIGINQRDLTRIFERFYQSAPSITRVRNGLGIGLAITKSFIEAHGGRIQVESTLEQGSTFHVYLPLTPLSNESPH
jgi:signal transduction histidine kinase/CheY-like chemotaxis protein